MVLNRINKFKNFSNFTQKLAKYNAIRLNNSGLMLWK
jgi:hypothetical protein